VLNHFENAIASPSNLNLRLQMFSVTRMADERFPAADELCHENACPSRGVPKAEKALGAVLGAGTLLLHPRAYRGITKKQISS